MSYKAYSNHVRQLVRDHILEFVNSDYTLENILQDHIASDYSSVLNGNFLAYYSDQREFLNSLDLNNNSKKEFTDDQVLKMYVHLVNRELEFFINLNKK